MSPLSGAIGADGAVMADPSPEVLFADFGTNTQVLQLQYGIRLGVPRVGPNVGSGLRRAISATQLFRMWALVGAAATMRMFSLAPVLLSGGRVARRRCRACRQTLAWEVRQAV